jgi:uncharacterized protein YbaP (TraB family)
MGGAKRLRHLLIPGFAALATASPAFADPAIWRVSDGDSSIHLFGSVHVFTREMDWRTPQFDGLLTAADKVVFEVVLNVDAYATIAQISLEKGRITDGTLADLLQPDDYAQLTAAAGTLGIEMAVLDSLQPWLATMTLMQAAGPSMVGGVELQIDAEIPATRKASLETAAEQMGFFADAPMDEQIANLMSAVHGAESGIFLTLDPLIDAWARGDADGLLDAMESQLTAADQPAYDRLIRQRNERWIGPLEQMLAENADNFVIVGAAHLVGETGVPSLLAAEGYTVERVDAVDVDTRPQALPGAVGRALPRR